MKIGILFTASSILLLFCGISDGNLYLLLLWPSASMGIVGFAYLFNNQKVFGKNEKGKLGIFNLLFLFPYIIYLSGIWRLLRLLKSENAVDRIDENLYIGRRLLSAELPDNIITVVDLTCEFSEPRKIINNTDYKNFKILDASAPNPEILTDFVKKLSRINNTIYIHCAEGHGRTGLVATLLLVAKGKADTFQEAYEILKNKRPLIRLKRIQKKCAEKCVDLLKNYKENI